jgi:hypothetical protein
MKRKDYQLLLEDSFYDKCKSPIPPHLTPEEYVIWKKEFEWERKEIERRRKLGYYSNEN